MSSWGSMLHEISNDSLGTLKDYYEAKIKVNHDASPRFCKAKQVPYALRPKMGEEVERLISEGILEPAYRTLRVSRTHRGCAQERPAKCVPMW